MIKVKFYKDCPSCTRTRHQGPVVTFDDLISLYQQCKDKGIPAEQAETFEAGFIFRMAQEGKPYPTICDRDMAFRMVYGDESKPVIAEAEERAEEWRREFGDADPLEILKGATEALKGAMYIMDIEDALEGEQNES